MDRSLFKQMGAIIAAAVIGFFPFVRGVRVPLLGWFDFGMHELGHLVFAWAGETVHFVAGSVVQVLVPLGLTAYFLWWRSDPYSSAITLAWTGASMADVAVYIADAPYERLPLIGGDHDWAFLLHKYDIMSSAEPFAAWVKGLGGLAIVAAVTLGAVGHWLGPRMAAAPFRVSEWRPSEVHTAAYDDPWDAP